LKSKPIIQKIKLSTEQLELVDKLQKGVPIPRIRTVTNKKRGYSYDITYGKRPPSVNERAKKLKEIYGGICSMCNQLPSYNVIFHYTDKQQSVSLIQRYCEQHLPKEYS
jgi:hypothetical protein